MTPDHVLVPLYGSPLGDEALSYALDIFDCQVTVLTVVTPLDESMSESGLLDPDESRRDEARERTEKLVERAKRKHASANRRVDVDVATGGPAEAILDYVGTHDVDHIVVAGLDDEGHEVAQRLLGTAATKVVSGASVTVTVVQ